LGLGGWGGCFGSISDTVIEEDQAFEGKGSIIRKGTGLMKKGERGARWGQPTGKGRGAKVEGIRKRSREKADRRRMDKRGKPEGSIGKPWLFLAAGPKKRGLFTSGRGKELRHEDREKNIL